MFPIFDTSKLSCKPLAERQHDLGLSVMVPMTPMKTVHPNLQIIAGEIKKAKHYGKAVILMMGAHVLRSGVQRYLIDLMEQGYISGMAVNGACAIHDFEFSLIGHTTESVARYITEGQFGLWQEIGQINDIIKTGTAKSMGAGAALGRAILEGEYPYKDFSIFAAGYRLKIPITVHVGIGYDIVFEHHECDGGAWGAASYKDFLHFTALLEAIEGGVVMNFGSAVMAPEVFLKALAMVRNVAKQENREIRRFKTLVSDIYPLPEDYAPEPKKDAPGYYFRPWKTMLIRTVADGGKSYYVRLPHSESIPQLWTSLTTTL